VKHTLQRGATMIGAGTDYRPLFPVAADHGLFRQLDSGGCTHYQCRRRDASLVGICSCAPGDRPTNGWKAFVLASFHDCGGASLAGATTLTRDVWRGFLMKSQSHVSGRERQAETKRGSDGARPHTRQACRCTNFRWSLWRKRTVLPKARNAGRGDRQKKGRPTGRSGETILFVFLPRSKTKSRPGPPSSPTHHHGRRPCDGWLRWGSRPMGNRGGL